jgi:DNA-directed RNA polymerase specialized sigma24 family protein
MLTEEQHTALWLRYAEELSPREVARVLERSEVSVRVMLFRARQALAPHAHAMLGEDGAVMLTSNAAGGVV